MTLSSEQAITIAAVADQGELRQGDLMGLPYLASEKSKVSRIVQGLVMEEYIDRRDDIHDRRSKILTLSEKGQMIADMMSQAESNNKLLLSSLLSNEDMSSLHKALEKIARAM
ncbi:MarR family transcriptional regulator [Grimontia sp. NTOU-MAR1]|uniref:MarR family transcriptional regulator n=1 Tax=Grimontia sp. NTOU-MAR1 TaxID=3111011 RepID=UPI002DB8ECA3|nr:MarR family transcriptional regulator [Grimontia sp. NTOU-MAR1]